MYIQYLSYLTPEPTDNIFVALLCVICWLLAYNFDFHHHTHGLLFPPKRNGFGNKWLEGAKDYNKRAYNFSSVPLYLSIQNLNFWKWPMPTVTNGVLTEAPTELFLKKTVLNWKFVSSQFLARLELAEVSNNVQVQAYPSLKFKIFVFYIFTNYLFVTIIITS